jgi:hypothetical protein
MHKVAAKVVIARSRADTVNPFEPERPAMPAETDDPFAGTVSLQSPEPLLTERESFDESGAIESAGERGEFASAGS